MDSLKSSARSHFLHARAALGTHGRQLTARKGLQNAASLLKGRSQILCYAAYRCEFPVLTELLLFLKGSNTKVFLPRVEAGNAMSFWEYEPGDILIENKWGIGEPDSHTAERWSQDSNTLAIVPALAADKQGNRLGYGGGYYDRFLQKHPDIETLSIVHSQALLAVSTWGVGVFDVPVSWVATDSMTLIQTNKS